MREGTLETIKAATPVTVAVTYFAGYTINEWAAFAALAYSLILIAEKLYKFWRDNIKKRKR